MSSPPQHWIVIPCYNEADRLPVETLRTWLQAHPEFAFLLVNDGSTDGTARVIDALAVTLPIQCAALQLPVNQGKAEAVRQGLLCALERDAVTIGYLDADLATPPDELLALLAALQSSADLDWAIGSRVRLLGRDIRRRAWRHYLGRIFAAGASLTLGLAVYDTQCGAKLLRVAPWTRPLLADPFLSKWIFDVELLARYLKLVRGAPRWPQGACGIIEVPLARWHDVGNSRVKPVDFLRAALDLFAIARRWSTRPIRASGKDAA